MRTGTKLNDGGPYRNMYFASVKFFSPSGGCYEIACALPREEVKYWKISEFSIPGKGELLWGQVAQRSVGSRVAQKVEHAAKR